MIKARFLQDFFEGIKFVSQFYDVMAVFEIRDDFITMIGNAKTTQIRHPVQQGVFRIVRYAYREFVIAHMLRYKKGFGESRVRVLSLGHWNP